MSPRRQPFSLYQQCTHYFSKILESLCQHPEDEFNNSEICKLMNYIHTFLPSAIKADIGGNLITHINQCQTILSPLQVHVVLSLQARCLTLYGSSLSSGILEDADASHIRKLTLLYRGCRDTVDKLYGFLGTASNLTHLTCTDFCNDKMLEIIAQCSTHLQYLNLNNCNDVTDDGILRLCGFETSMKTAIDTLARSGTLQPTSRVVSSLKEMNLKMTKVTQAGVAMILLKLTNICLLRVPDIPMEKVFNFLKELDQQNSENTESNLTEFRCREILDEHQLSVLTSLCPNLEYMQMTFVGNYEIDLVRVEKLTKLQKLRSAKFADIDIEAVLMYLKIVGANIRYLFLYAYHLKFSANEALTIRPDHLLSIGKYCPNLESFHLEGYDLQEDILGISPYKNELPLFQNLHTLELESMKLSEEDLKVFLLNCRNMKILDLVLKDPHVLDDRLVEDLLDKGLWNNLKKVRILNSPITSKVMVRLVNECPNLRELGCLTTWLVARQQVFDFKEMVRHENLDVVIYS